jgi:dihydropteroate synthase
MPIALEPARSAALWRLPSRTVELGRRTLVMGIVNLTPDSFSDGGSHPTVEAAVAHAIRLLDEGADILDLGAESTRPGSHAGGPDAAVDAAEEQDRLLPALEAILRERPGTLISIDTYKAATARAALTAGAEIINDVSGFAWDAAMPAVCAESGCGLVLMHTRGQPDEWSTQPPITPEALFTAVRAGLDASLTAATSAGILADAIVLDPGYGFGKRGDENFSLLARQHGLLTLGRPLLAGLSRKSFLGHTLADLHGGMPAPVSARENASLAALVAAILKGASIVRVHSVRPAVEAARTADALLNAH